jgi:hypothetical protein
VLLSLQAKRCTNAHNVRNIQPVTEKQSKKTSAINARISDDLRGRLSEISRRYGPNDSTMVEDALSALADCVERSGKYLRPMKMMLDEDADSFARSLAAEDQSVRGHPAPQAAATAALRQLRKAEREPEGKRPAAHK